MKKSCLFLRLTAVLLSLIITIVSVPMAVIAEEGESGDNGALTQNDTQNIDASDETVSESLIEDMSKRDSFTKHYVAPDGSRYAVVFAEQVHYKEGEEWHEVDNRLTLDTSAQKYIAGNPMFTAGFSSSTSSEQLVSISDGEHTLSWSVRFPTTGGGNMSATATTTSMEATLDTLTVATANAQLLHNGETAEITTVENMESMGKATSSLRYNGVYGGSVDLRYTILHGKVEEDVILNSLGSFTSYILVVNTGGLEAAVQEGGSVTFSDDGGSVFTIAAPWMMDANGEISADIDVDLIQRGDTAYINYAPSRTWLTAPDRAYPVLIDPSFTTSYYTSNYVDTYVTADNVGSVERATSTLLKVGGTNYPYIKILNIPTFSESYEITNVKLNLYSTDVTSPKPLNLHEVTYWWNWELLHGYPDLELADDPYALEYIYEPSSIEILSNVEAECDEESTVSTYTFDITEWLNVKFMNSGGDYFSSDYWHGFRVSSTNNNYIMNICSSEYVWAGYRPTITIGYTYTHDDIFENGAIYSIKSALSDNYLTIAYGNDSIGPNVYQYAPYIYNPTNATHHSQKFRLEYVQTNNSFVIRATVNNNGEGNIVKYDYNDTMDSTNNYANGYIPANIYLGSYSSLPYAIQDWIFECVDGHNIYKIVSRDDPNLALTVSASLNGSNIVGDVLANGNIYVSKYVGATSQHWKIESAGYTLSSQFPSIKTADCIYVGTNAIGENLTCPVTNLGDTVTWTSANNDIISFDEDGLIDTLNIGTTQVSATVAHENGTHDTYTRQVIVRFAKGICFIQNPETERYIYNHPGEIYQYDFDISKNEQWLIEWADDEYYYIKSARNKRYLAINSGNTSEAVQGTSRNNYSLWKLQRTDTGGYKLICKATEGSGLVLSVPLAADENGTNLVNIAYTDNANYKDEWFLYHVEYEATIKNYYDSGYYVYYGETASESESFIYECSVAVAERYVQLFGLCLTIDSDAEYYESTADACKGTTTSENIDTLCTHERIGTGCLHHTHYATMYSDFLSNQQYDSSLLEKVSHVIWSGHKLESNEEDIYNRSFSNPATRVVLMINRYGDHSTDSYYYGSREGLTLYVLMHELAHQFGAPDHYHEEDENNNCIRPNICSVCNPAFSQICIMGGTSKNIYTDNPFCDYCLTFIMPYLNSYNKFTIN